MEQHRGMRPPYGARIPPNFPGLGRGDPFGRPPMNPFGHNLDDHPFDYRQNPGDLENHRVGRV